MQSCLSNPKLEEKYLDTKIPPFYSRNPFQPLDSGLLWKIVHQKMDACGLVQALTRVIVHLIHEKNIPFQKDLLEQIMEQA